MQCLEVADFVIVVDDACPQETGSVVPLNERVQVVRHRRNLGVGGAMKTGILKAIEQQADYIVKVDADAQMDVSYVPSMIAILQQHPETTLVKGNRFADLSTVRGMPVIRLIGNSVLSFLVKLSSGYWAIVDPTNGFIALRASSIPVRRFLQLADRYFFEIDLLCLLGVTRRTIAELEMPAIYNGGISSLSVWRTMFSFPLRLISAFTRRVLINYVVVEINVGSLCALLGLPLLLGGMIFGGHEWALSVATGISRPTGTIILALLLFVLGFQLLLQAILYDVQHCPKIRKVRADPFSHSYAPDLLLLASYNKSRTIED